MTERSRAAPPPTAIRRCSGVTYHSPRFDWRTGTRAPAHTDPCRAGAIAFVTEVNYCWGHIPAEWRVIAERRRELWAAQSIELWEKIRAEVPGL